MRFIIVGFALLCGVTAPASPLLGQDQTEVSRRVVNKVAPQYPSMARTMHLSGTVRIEAVVDSSGKVKSTEIKGGHPVLAQAVANAVMKWRWQPTSYETRELVEVTFTSP